MKQVELGKDTDHTFEKKRLKRKTFTNLIGYKLISKFFMICLGEEFIGQI